MIDYAKIEQAMVARALVGLERAGTFTLEKARQHAPVRAIFKGRMRGPAYSATAESGKGLRNSMYGKPLNQKFAPDRPIRTKSQYERWQASRQPNRRIDTGRGMEKLLGDTEASVSGANREMMRGIGDLDEAYASTGHASRSRLSGEQGGSVIRGHPNSLIPVRRFSSGPSKGWRMTGDLRKFDKKTGGLANVVGIAQKGKNTIVQMINPTVFLTKAGKNELKIAARAGRTTALYKGRIGGRLRGELRLTSPETRGKTTWVYVESPTPYAGYQEFGTSRHRSQPFLRPALYESRQVLRYEVRRAVDKSFAAPGVRSKNLAGLAD